MEQSSNQRPTCTPCGTKQTNQERRRERTRDTEAMQWGDVNDSMEMGHYFAMTKMGQECYGHDLDDNYADDDDWPESYKDVLYCDQGGRFWTVVNMIKQEWGVKQWKPVMEEVPLCEIIAIRKIPGEYYVCRTSSKKIGNF